MDPKYGSELVTEKQSVSFFDEFDCMLNFKEFDEGKGQEYKHIF